MVESIPEGQLKEKIPLVYFRGQKKLAHGREFKIYKERERKKEGKDGKERKRGRKEEKKRKKENKRKRGEKGSKKLVSPATHT